MMLTADVAAIAIVTAARLCQVHPLMVLDEIPTPKADQIGVSRARSYAAVALDEVLNAGCEPKNYRVSRAAIGRSVGATPASESGIIAAIRINIGNGSNKWWREGDFRQVCAAVASEIERSGRIEPSPSPAPPKPKNVDSVATTSIGRIKAAPPPKTAPVPGAAPPQPQPIVAPAPMCVGGVTVDVDGGIVSANGYSVTFDQDTALFIHTLVRVMPALLDEIRIATKVWGHPSARIRLPEMMQRANPALEMIQLKIRHMPKAGYSISKA
ncbi:MAG: hypothetical protein JSS57_07565 [Proteobacteria bacterium]|nr:hypothetical protein [Pseudomonadota bacterium]